MDNIISYEISDLLEERNGKVVTLKAKEQFNQHIFYGFK